MIEMIQEFAEVTSMAANPEQSARGVMIVQGFEFAVILRVQIQRCHLNTANMPHDNSRHGYTLAPLWL